MVETNARALRAHDRFQETEPDVFELRSLSFDGWVRVGEDEIVLVQEVPTLDATVEGETVAPVVEDGWYETFERRLEDATKVTTGDVAEPVVTRDGETIRIETRIAVGPSAAPDEAVAIASYVEGTWVEGIIPGYDYDDRVQSIRNRARTNAQGPPADEGR